MTIGCDEVGTGDYFGPLVVCCAYVPEELISKLQAMGIKDSKALEDPEICHLPNKSNPLLLIKSSFFQMKNIIQ